MDEDVEEGVARVACRDGKQCVCAVGNEWGVWLWRSVSKQSCFEGSDGIGKRA